MAAQSYRDRPSLVRLVLVGELDMAGWPALAAGTRALAALPRSLGAPRRAALLDLARLSTLDIAGLSHLLRARDSLEAAGWPVRIVRPAVQVQLLLRVAAGPRLAGSGDAQRVHDLRAGRDCPVTAAASTRRSPGRPSPGPGRMTTLEGSPPAGPCDDALEAPDGDGPVSSRQAMHLVRSALAHTGEFGRAQVDVLVAGTRIALFGTVATWETRERVELAAWFTGGVIRVDNHVLLHGEEQGR